MDVAAGVFASPSAKKAWASATGRSSTSAMLSPPNRSSSTDAWNRLPPQSSHSVATVSMKLQLRVVIPLPLQVGQAPSEFARTAPA